MVKTYPTCLLDHRRHDLEVSEGLQPRVLRGCRPFCGRSLGRVLVWVLGWVLESWIKTKAMLVKMDV